MIQTFIKYFDITLSNSLLRASQLDLKKNFGHCAVLQAIASTSIYILVKTYQINKKTYN